MDPPSENNASGGRVLSERPSSAPPDFTTRPSLGTRFRASVKSGISTPLKRIFSSKKDPAPVSTPSTSEATTKSTLEGTSTPGPQKLVSEPLSVIFQKDLVDPTRQISAYENAILIIDTFQQGVKLTEFVLPSLVSNILGGLVKAIDVLKQMVENREAWKELLNTLIDHHQTFNAQIARLKEENTMVDRDSPLLGPLGGYSEALKQLTANVIADSGLVQGNGPLGSVEKIKQFIGQYTEAGSEQIKIEKYHGELVTAMRQLMQNHVMYTAFTVQRMDSKLDQVIAGTSVPKRTTKITAKRAPAVTQFHVPRERETEYMADCLVNSPSPGQKIFVITGMGGCGKTQLVSHFLDENKHMFTHLVYVDAVTTASIQADLQRWAQSLGGVHEEDDWNNAIELLSEETGDMRWVLVLDNADDPRLELAPFLPASGSGIVIITSRNKAVGNLATNDPLELGEMSKDEALTTLLNAARRDRGVSPEDLDNARALTTELGCLPVVLVHAGAYCHSLSSHKRGVHEIYTFGQYRDLFRSRRAGLLRKMRASTLDGYKGDVYTTLDLSYDQLLPISQDFVCLASNFHYSDIPVAMLEAAAMRGFHDPDDLLIRSDGHQAIISRLNAEFCFDGSWDAVQMNEIIQNLQSLSLVSTASIDGARFLNFHPLVQAWARDKTIDNAPLVTEEYQSMATQIITSSCTDEHIGLYRYLLPHILEILAVVPQNSLHINDVISLARTLGNIVQRQQAEELLNKALETLRSSSPDDTEAIMLLTSCLAALCYLQGRSADAEKLGLEVLENFTRILGIDHPRTITATYDLSRTYQQQGRYKEAEGLQLEVLQKRTKISGPDHGEVLKAAHELAITYRDQGRWKEAETLQLDVLERRTRTLGPQHPDTITSISHLAWTYCDQGRWKEAETLELDVLKKRTSALGPEHPDTIEAAHNLAATYYNQGRQKEAETLQLDVLEKWTKTLGPEHPDTSTAATNLANTYSDQGRWKETETLRLDVLEKRTRTLGPDHPGTIRAANNLAVTYWNQGRWKEAETLQLDVLEKRTRTLGPDHPGTIRAANNLANTYRAQRRWKEAEYVKQHKRIMVDYPDGSQVADSADTPERVEMRQGAAEGAASTSRTTPSTTFNQPSFTNPIRPLFSGYERVVPPDLDAPTVDENVRRGAEEWLQRQREKDLRQALRLEKALEEKRVGLIKRLEWKAPMVEMGKGYGYGDGLEPQMETKLPTGEVYKVLAWEERLAMEREVKRVEDTLVGVREDIVKNGGEAGQPISYHASVD